MVITVQDLLDAGYRRYKDNWKESDGLYQKRIADAEGKKYYISYYHYRHRHPGGTAESMMADVQFELKNGSRINVEYLSAGKHPISEIEAFYEHFYNTMDCTYVDSF